MGKNLQTRHLTRYHRASQGLAGCSSEKQVSSEAHFPLKGKRHTTPTERLDGEAQLDDDTRQELRRKKLCFRCQEPWVPGHRCSGKGKAHYIEVYSDSGDDGDETDQEQEGLQVAEEEQKQAET